MRQLLAERVKELRASVGLDQSKFARKVDMSRSTLIGLEKGTKVQIDIGHLFKMFSMGLDITPAPVEDIKENVNRDKELEFFERCINEDRTILSDFCNWLKMYKDELKEYTLSGIREAI